MKRRGRLSLTPELLADVLKLPDGAVIYGADFELRANGGIVILLYVEHPDLPELAEGQQTTPVIIEYEMVRSHFVQIPP